MTLQATETERRLANIANVGVVTGTDPAKSMAKVQIGDLSTPLIKVGMMRAGNYRISWMPSKGEQVLVIAPSGDLAQAVIACSIPTDAMTSHVQQPHIDLKGDKMLLKGDLVITGNITVSGYVDAEGDVTAGPISLQKHIHSGVKAGPSTTGKPQ